MWMRRAMARPRSVGRGWAPFEAFLNSYKFMAAAARVGKGERDPSLSLSPFSHAAVDNATNVPTRKAAQRATAAVADPIRRSLACNS